MATHSSILARRIPWTEEPGGLKSTGSQRIRHYWATECKCSLILWCLLFVSVHLCLCVPFTVHEKPCYNNKRWVKLQGPWHTWSSTSRESLLPTAVTGWAHTPWTPAVDSGVWISCHCPPGVVLSLSTMLLYVLRSSEAPHGHITVYKWVCLLLLPSQIHFHFFSSSSPYLPGTFYLLWSPNLHPESSLSSNTEFTSQWSLVCKKNITLFRGFFCL